MRRTSIIQDWDLGNRILWRYRRFVKEIILELRSVIPVEFAPACLTGAGWYPSLLSLQCNTLSEYGGEGEEPGNGHPYPISRNRLGAEAKPVRTTNSSNESEILTQ